MGTWRDLRRRSDYATFFSLLIREKEEIGAFEKLLPGQEGGKGGKLEVVPKAKEEEEEAFPLSHLLWPRGHITIAVYAGNHGESLSTKFFYAPICQ